MLDTLAPGTSSSMAASAINTHAEMSIVVRSEMDTMAVSVNGNMQ